MREKIAEFFGKIKGLYTNEETKKKAFALEETAINTLNSANEDMKKAAKEDQEVQRAEKAAEKKDNNSADSADSEKNGFEKSGDSENKKEEKDK